MVTEDLKIRIAYTFEGGELTQRSVGFGIFIVKCELIVAHCIMFKLI